MAMNFIGNVDGAASFFSNGNFARFFRFQVPNGVIEFRVLEQLISGHGRHGDVSEESMMRRVYARGCSGQLEL